MLLLMHFCIGYFNILEMLSKNKILAFLIFMFTGQLIAFLVWYLFKLNIFIALSVSSVIAFILGYKEKNVSKSV